MLSCHVESVKLINFFLHFLGVVVLLVRTLHFTRKDGHLIIRQSAGCSLTCDIAWKISGNRIIAICPGLCNGQCSVFTIRQCHYCYHDVRHTASIFSHQFSNISRLKSCGRVQWEKKHLEWNIYKLILNFTTNKYMLQHYTRQNLKSVGKNPEKTA